MANITGMGEDALKSAPRVFIQITSRKMKIPNRIKEKCPNTKLKCCFGLNNIVIKEDIIMHEAQQVPTANPMSNENIPWTS